MTEVVIYVARPTTDRGLWRLATGNRAEHFYASEAEAVTAAIALARFFENAGQDAIVKVEQPNGLWEVRRE
ncbi:hypothetical protein [Luteibacter sp. 3190]|uniref:hypothetical protein n=1 Tax=Luteibacter sp. 3190 TaxID=2817736 RepID=UPI0028568DB9|nr:hypothetical protein [Luteibacter sp. 3190]MDR6935716.1 hypothetical protein [Luteibacter sp. 3190]